MMKTYIMTGEMAKLHNVSKETLRYYHKIGLLIPEYIDEKGYRYYGLQQFAYLDSILFLRELGFSIEEIQDYFKRRNLDSVLYLLREKESELKRQIGVLQEKQQVIMHKVNKLEKYRHEEQGICTIKPLPKRYIASQTIKHYTSIRDFEFGLKGLNQSIQNNLSLFRGLIGLALEANHIVEEAFEQWDKVIVVFEEKIMKEMAILESGSYATITYRGRYDEGLPYYKQLLNWIKTHHFTIEGDCLLLTLSDSAFSSDPKDYRIEIQIKIK